MPIHRIRYTTSYKRKNRNSKHVECIVLWAKEQIIYSTGNHLSVPYTTRTTMVIQYHSFEIRLASTILDWMRRWHAQIAKFITTYFPLFVAKEVAMAQERAGEKSIQRVRRTKSPVCFDPIPQIWRSINKRIEYKCMFDRNRRQTRDAC